MLKYFLIFILHPEADRKNDKKEQEKRNGEYPKIEGGNHHKIKKAQGNITEILKERNLKKIQNKQKQIKYQHICRPNQRKKGDASDCFFHIPSHPFCPQLSRLPVGQERKCYF
mgnify:CR=1 FL=1